MAQTGYTPISLYYSSTASAVPTAGNLIAGELALNTADGKLYFKNSSNVVTLLAGAGGAGVVAGSNTQIQFNNSGVFGASANLTWDGSKVTASAYQTGGNLTFTGTGNRITGDFTNATHTSRVLFQTSTANSSTILGAIPNGTSTTAQLNLYNNSDPTNASLFQAITGTGEVSLRGAITGTGTYLPMTFYTGGSERVRVDTSGNVGIGVVPSAWSQFKAIDIGSGAIANYTGTTPGGTSVSTNVYWNGTSYVYKNTGAVTLYSVAADGTFVWYNAASGTAGTTLSLTERMRIDSSGNVGIGTSSPGYKLQVSGAIYQDNGYAQFGNYNAGGANSPVAGGISFSTNITNGQAEADVWNGNDPASYANTGILFTQRLTSTTRRDLMFLHNNGNVGIGTNSPGVKLDVQVSGGEVLKLTATTGTNSIYQTINNTGGSFTIGRENSAGTAFGVSAYASVLFSAGAYPMVFATQNIERMRIDSSGNVGIGTASGSARLSVNGGTSTSQIRWEVNNAAFTQEVSTNAAANAYVYKSNDASYHVWKLSSTEAMRLTSTGGISFGSTGTNYGTSGQVLTSAGSAAPTWTNISTLAVRRTGNVGAMNFNSYTTTSQVVGFDTPNTNGPASVTYSSMLVMQERSDTSSQLVIDYNTGYLYTRGIYLTAPTYTAWRTYLNDANYNSYSPTLTGTGASGTWGISITGNSATVGGFTPSQTAGTANRVVVADANGYILNNYFNSTDNAVTSGVTAVMSKTGDNYYRSASAAAVATFISGQTMNISGTATNVSGTVAAANGGTGFTTGVYGFKNRVTNGAFVIRQNVTGSSGGSGTGAALRAMDCWVFSVSSTSTYGYSTSIVSSTLPTPESGVTVNALQVSNTNVGGTGVIVGHRIESILLNDLYNTTVTVSLYCSTSSSATVGWSALYPNTANTYSFAGNSLSSGCTLITSGTFTTTSSLAYKSFSFNIGTNAPTNGLMILFSNPNGSTQTITVANVQLEKGSTATVFDYLPYQDDLLRVSRYYGQSGGTLSTTTTGQTLCQPRTAMRTNPTVTLGFPAGSGGTAVMTTYGSANGYGSIIQSTIHSVGAQSVIYMNSEL